MGSNLLHQIKFNLLLNCYFIGITRSYQNGLPVGEKGEFTLYLNKKSSSKIFKKKLINIFFI